MSGIKTIRTKVEEYKGYPIFLLRVIDKSSKFISKHCVYQYYGIGVKGGNIRIQKDRYETIVCNIEQARNMVDEIENGVVHLTEWEHTIWVSRPNAECCYSFTKDRLLSIWRVYPKANERRKLGYLERLHDANFHDEANAIENGDIEKFNQCLKEVFG